MSRRRLILGAWLTGAAILLALLSLVGAFEIIQRSARHCVLQDLASMPRNEVGLALGTSKFSRGGFRNPHFINRMRAAAALYHSGRVDHFLLSGDNGARGYDEPADMQAALEILGVPAEAISADDDGFRTLDSMVRAKRVFNQQKSTVVTDRFHAYRAVFLAKHQGIDAVAYSSADVELRYSVNSRLRECLADVKAYLDLWVLHTQPKFLGEPNDLLLARC